MSTAKGSSMKKRSSEATEPSKSKSQRVVDSDDVTGRELSSDTKGIMTAFPQIKEKTQKDETLSSDTSWDIKAKIDEQISQARKSFDNAISESSLRCENLLRREAAKFENLLKSETAKLQALCDTVQALKGTHSVQETGKLIIERAVDYQAPAPHSAAPVSDRSTAPVSDRRLAVYPPIAPARAPAPGCPFPGCTRPAGPHTLAHELYEQEFV